MEYKGYAVTADVQSWDVWTLDENGKLADWSQGLDGVEVVRYNFRNETTGDHFASDDYIGGEHDFSGEPENIQELVDDRLIELAKAAV